MAIIFQDSYQLNAPKPVDNKYMRFISGAARAYLDVAEANEIVVASYRYQNLTVLIKGSPVDEEYWYQNGVADGNLVVKNQSTSGVSGYSGKSGTNGASGASGTSGYSGTSGATGPGGGSSGTSGTSGASGTSGQSGTSGASGTSGTSGKSGIGTSGTSGYSGTSGATGGGASGASGTSGFSGTSGAVGPGGGASGASGTSGYSGKSGTSGSNGASGTSGTSGQQAASGVSGYSGQSGSSGVSGAGASGQSGYSGTSGQSGTSGGTGVSGTSGYSGRSGASGTSGATGSGSAGTSGTSGYSGTSGATGGGTSGTSGTSGKSGYSGQNGSGSGDVILRTLSALRSETSTVTTVRYYVTDTGKEGLWYYDGSDTTTADNTGLVVVAGGTRRYKRIYDGENVDVRWFDVNGDGTNETVEFQLALNNTAGKSLWIKNITIKMGGAIGSSGSAYSIIFSGDRRKIIGQNGIIKYITNGSQPDYFWYMNSISYLEISGVELDMESLAGDPVSGTNLWWFESCSHLRVYDNYLHDNGHAAMRILNGNFIHVENNIITTTDSCIFCERSAFGTDGASDLVITGNQISGGTSEGIGVFSHGTAANINKRWLISNNTIKNKTTSAAFNVCRSQYGNITGNVVDGCYAAAYVLDSGSGFAYNEFATDIDFSGNVYSNMTTGILNLSDRCSVIGDKFTNVGRTCILTNNHLDSGSANHNVTVTGLVIKDCQFHNCANENQAFPIMELQDLVKSSICNNTITASTNTSVKAMRLYNLSNCVIQGNDCWDSKFEWFNTDTGSFDNYNVFKDNLFLDANMDLSSINPVGTYNWLWEQNVWQTLVLDPTNAFYYAPIASGILDVNSRFMTSEYRISTTTVTGIRQSWYAREVTFVLTGSTTFTHSSTLSLVGATSFTGASGNRITFRCDGSTTWREKFRSVS